MSTVGIVSSAATTLEEGCSGHSTRRSGSGTATPSRWVRECGLSVPGGGELPDAKGMRQAGLLSAQRGAAQRSQVREDFTLQGRGTVLCGARGSGARAGANSISTKTGGRVHIQREPQTLVTVVLTH